VRHERPALVLLLSLGTVLGGAAGCEGDRLPAPPPGHPAPVLDSDTVSGCVTGAALVKVLVELNLDEKGRCVPEVTPASVCVAAGGVVRFRVHNRCTARGDAGRPAVLISQPVFKRKLAAPREEEKPAAARDERRYEPLFRSCELTVAKISQGADHVVLCDVDTEAYEGFYKYGVTGHIEPLDPDVEVRPGKR
jgi:hypothetical protein